MCVDPAFHNMGDLPTHHMQVGGLVMNGSRAAILDQMERSIFVYDMASSEDRLYYELAYVLPEEVAKPEMMAGDHAGRLIVAGDGGQTLVTLSLSADSVEVTRIIKAQGCGYLDCLDVAGNNCLTSSLISGLCFRLTLGQKELWEPLVQARVTIPFQACFCGEEPVVLGRNPAEDWFIESAAGSAPVAGLSRVDFAMGFSVAGADRFAILSDTSVLTDSNEGWVTRLVVIRWADDKTELCAELPID